MSKFKVGDLVRCIDSLDRAWNQPLALTEGRIYNIAAVSPNGSFSIIDDSGHRGNYMSKRFELVKEEAVTAKFKAGDRVRCVNDLSTMGEIVNGRIYSVKYCNADGDLCCIVDGDENLGYHAVDRFKLVGNAATAEIKDGDQVRCVNAEHEWPLALTEGKVYNIITAYPNGSFSIVADDGREGFYMSDRFELIKEETVTAKFKAGDRVRCSNSFENPSITDGKVYTVIDTNLNGHPSIIDNDGHCRYYNVRLFELVKDEPVQTISADYQRLYERMMEVNDFEATTWMAGLKGEVPRGWEKTYQQLQQESDPEYQEYLRLKAKFGNR